MPAKPFSNSGRDAFTSHSGAGKGDAPRHNQDKFSEGYDAIKWPAKMKGRFRKVYGPRRAVPFSTLAAEPVNFSGAKDR